MCNEKQVQIVMFLAYAAEILTEVMGIRQTTLPKVRAF
jgi:hypothetical protein